MDAGPIIGGYGMAACAFGLASARSNGRYDHAYPLAAQMLAASWPLPDGTLLLPRLLSSSSDAPYLGEAAILFTLARQPVGETAVRPAGRLPLLVFGILAAYLGASLLILLGAFLRMRRALRCDIGRLRWAKAQLLAWSTFVCVGMALLATQNVGVGMLLLALAQLLPQVSMEKAPAAESFNLSTLPNAAAPEEMVCHES